MNKCMRSAKNRALRMCICKEAGHSGLSGLAKARRNKYIIVFFDNTTHFD